MRRRKFLQLAGSAAAGAVAAHASRVLVVADVAITGIAVKTTLNATVLITNMPGFSKQQRRLGVSGWISSDVIHVMLEREPEAPWSHPQLELPGLQPGRRYQLRIMNGTPAAIAVHLPSHRLEVARYNVVDVDLIAGAETSV